jgi:aspartyl-tRNA(Asn)/glutamyl-tRNA(Gln) amidotransferase subunit B
MEKGAMRCEPNVSVRPVGSEEMGVKTEIKNLNSFRAVKMAIDYEIARQIAVLEAGQEVKQVTMGWNERENRTVVQRSKEYAEDYRYFPEPDLPPLQLSHEYVSAIQDAMPELPRAKRERFASAYGIRPQDAAALAMDVEVSNYFETCVRASESRGIEARTVGNWVLGELFRLLNETNTEISASPVGPAALIDLLNQVERKTITVNTAKRVLAEMFATGATATAIIKEQGLAQIRDAGQIEGLVEQVLADNPGPVSQYLAGKESVLGFLMGQVMRASQGKADPQLVRGLLREHLQSARPEGDAD